MRETGLRSHVDVSLQETLAYHESLIRTYAFDGYSLQRAGSQHPQVAPANIFPTRDGYVYLFIAEQHWRRFLACWPDHAAALDDPKLLPNYARRRQAAWITEQVSAFTREWERDALVTMLQDQGIPCLPVNAPGDFLSDAQVQFRRLFLPTQHPVLGTYTQPALPTLIDGGRVLVAPPPLLGEHTRAVLDTAPLAVLDAAPHAPAHPPRAGSPAPSDPPRASRLAPAFLESKRDGDPLAESASRTAAAKMPQDPAAPLGSVRVLSLTTGIAGPHAARALAQSGAEVIKLESRQGGLDSFRLFSPDGDLNASPRFVEANLNVVSAQLNLKHPTGVRLFRELAAQADVVLDNFGADVLSRLGLGPDELRALKPDLIVLKMPGLGCAGPKHRWRTWGSTLNAFTGMTYLWNHPGQERPIGYQGVYPDYVTAALAPALVYAALLYRQRTGHGVFLDLAQAEVPVYLLGVSFLELTVNGRDPRPAGNAWPHAAPHNVYPCASDATGADGGIAKPADRWCAIAVESDDQWQRLCGALGRPELGDDVRYATLAARQARLAEVDALVAAWTREREAPAAMQALQAVGVPCGVVQLGEDLFADPQLRARGAIVSVEHARLGTVPLADVPLRLNGERLAAPHGAPILGAHNAHVYCDVLGYSPEQLAVWQREGVVD